jgi:isopenicillin N synthase-like dioxygenase
MNIFKALAVQDVEEATRAIPLIDVGPVFQGVPGALETVAQEVRRACETIGFFYLAGHGVPQAIIDAAFAASREFHALPLDEKLALRINENNIGYLAVNQSMQRHSTVHKATPRTSTRASSSATTGRSITPTWWPADLSEAATSGPPATRRCARRWSPTSRR